jgi:hypothetical protein
MRISLLVYRAAIFLLILSSSSLFSQTWNFVKEKDGIRLFIRQDTNSSFKSFRGEVDFRGDFEKASSLVGDPSNIDWWGDDVYDINILFYEKGRQIKYYLVYDVPWPFTDRDLVADVQLNEDPVSGIRTVYSRPLPNVVPQKPGLIRVTDYWQKWTLQPLKNGMIHITLEGFVDPSGSVPAWLYNMVIIDIPLRLLREVRKRAQK